MSGKSFAELSLPDSWGPWGGDFIQSGWSWVDGFCRMPRGLECAHPALAHVTSVPEPGAALLMACGLIAIFRLTRLGARPTHTKD